MHPDVSRPLTRRTTLSRLAAAGAAAWLVPAWNQTVEAAQVCVAATPTVTEGPYWVDEKLFRSDIRSDPSTGAVRDGVPMTLNITIQNLSTSSCDPLVDAYIDIWHCDAKGIYSDEARYNPGGGTGTVTTTGQKFLRGYQITDSNGSVTFTTIYPGWYSGRTIHIHFRIRTYSGTTLLGNFVSQIFFDDSVNNTVLASSAYSRTTARDTTNAGDNVYQIANKERMLATVSGSVTDGYTASITAGVSITAGSLAPSITEGGVVNALSAAAGLSPGSWATIYGTGFTSASRALTPADVVNNALPSALGGVSVQINGSPAFLSYVSPTQINVLAPSGIGTGSAAIVVSNSSASSNAATAVSQAFLPGLAVLNSYVRAVRYPDNAIVNGTGTAESGFTTSAAIAPGGILSLFGTGFGPVSSAPDTGIVFNGAYPAAGTVTVTIGNVPAEVLWAGLVAAGLYQINISVPASLPDGDHAVLASAGGVTSAAGALLKVAASAKLAAQSLSAVVFAHFRSRKQRFLPLESKMVEYLSYASGPNPGSTHARDAQDRAAERQGGIVRLA